MFIKQMYILLQHNKVFYKFQDVPVLWWDILWIRLKFTCRLRIVAIQNFEALGIVCVPYSRKNRY